MKILIKSAIIIDPASKFHDNKKYDILIENGIITSIKSKISAPANSKVIESKNLYISQGWFDTQVSFCDPGYEYKEDLKSGINAAAAGGFSAVAVVSSTNPPVDTKSDIEYIINKAKGKIVDVFPIGSISLNQKGEDLAEMYDMHIAGAVAFSDDKKPIKDAGFLIRALLYAQNFNSPVITHCDDHSVSMGGKMNEGVTSTLLGLKGIPGLAEELMISRNIFIAEYVNAPIHISNISTAKSVSLIKEAKSKGIKVTCSVNAYNLAMDDSALMDFNSNYKLNPPLRTKKDIEALWKGITDGTIDIISSDHRPQDIESKNIEFDDASNGMIGLETCFALINTFKGKAKMEKVITALTANPRKLFKIKESPIEEGQQANLTLFDPELSWTFEKKNIVSKSSNTPFVGKEFKGKVIGILNNKQLSINQ